MSQQKTQTDFAIQQFVGFGHARKGYDVIGLVEAMGLTKAEWQVIKDEVRVWLISTGMDDFTEVEQYFRRKR